MATNLTTVSNWDSVQRIETSDRVLGGELGTINIQARQLANRDHWLKDYIDGQIATLATAIAPYYNVIVADQSNLTLPSQFTSPITTYRHISMGSIFTGNSWTHYSGNSVLHTMTINVLSTTTLDFKAFAVNNNVYIYLDGVLKSSSGLYNNARTPRDLSFEVLPGQYVLQVVKNDITGIGNLCLAAQVIKPDVLFVP